MSLLTFCRNLNNFISVYTQRAGHEFQIKKQGRSRIQHGIHDGCDLLIADIFYAYFVFCDAFFDRFRRALDEVLGLLEAEARELADDLDDRDLVRPDLGQHRAELALLLGGGRGSATRRGSGRRRGSRRRGGGRDAGAMLATSSTQCSVYTLNITPNAPGTGTITSETTIVRSGSRAMRFTTDPGGIRQFNWDIGAGMQRSATARQSFNVQGEKT